MQFKGKINAWHNGTYGAPAQNLITTFSRDKILHHLDSETGLPYPYTGTAQIWLSNCPYTLSKEKDDNHQTIWKITIMGNSATLKLNAINKAKANWMHKRYKIQNEPIGTWGLIIAAISLIWQIVSTWIEAK